MINSDGISNCRGINSNHKISSKNKLKTPVGSLIVQKKVHRDESKKVKPLDLSLLRGESSTETSNTEMSNTEASETIQTYRSLMKVLNNDHQNGNTDHHDIDDHQDDAYVIQNENLIFLDKEEQLMLKSLAEKFEKLEDEFEQLENKVAENNSTNNISKKSIDSDRLYTSTIFSQEGTPIYYDKNFIDLNSVQAETFQTSEIRFNGENESSIRRDEEDLVIENFGSNTEHKLQLGSDVIQFCNDKEDPTNFAMEILDGSVYAENFITSKISSMDDENIVFDSGMVQFKKILLDEIDSEGKFVRMNKPIHGTGTNLISGGCINIFQKDDKTSSIYISNEKKNNKWSIRCSDEVKGVGNGRIDIHNNVNGNLVGSIGESGNLTVSPKSEIRALYRTKINDHENLKGYVVVSTGEHFGYDGTTYSKIESFLPEVVLSSEKEQSNFVGVIDGFEEDVREVRVGNFVSVTEQVDKINRCIVLTSGITFVWVSDENGEIKKGDLIATSSVKGVGMKQYSTPDYVSSWSIGRSLQDCNFDVHEKVITKKVVDVGDGNLVFSNIYNNQGDVIEDMKYEYKFYDLQGLPLGFEAKKKLDGEIYLSDRSLEIELSTTRSGTVSEASSKFTKQFLSNKKNKKKYYTVMKIGIKF